LVGIDGTEKMSKSLGNAIGISEPPREIYGKVMSIPDALMWSYYELLTDVPSSEIAALRRGIEEGANPRDAKARLAREITAEFQGPDAAAAAEEDFRRAFSAGELPSSIDRKAVGADARDWPAAKVLVEVGLAASMREARRKIAEGALTVYPEGSDHPQPTSREVRDPNEKILAVGEPVIRLGRRFLQVVPAAA
jgi:tyrosyl-tRNA synthetase